MIKAIVFDCFGVLVSESWSGFVDQYATDSSMRRAAFDAQSAMDTGFITEADFIDQVADLFGLDEAFVRQNILQGHRSNEALFSYIRRLNPNYKLALLSNVSSRERINEVLTNSQVALFDEVVLSNEVQLLKPDERIFRLTAERIGCEPEECVFVDDIERNCHGAEMVGMKVVHYKNFPEFERDIANLLQ